MKLVCLCVWLHVWVCIYFYTYTVNDGFALQDTERQISWEGEELK